MNDAAALNLLEAMVRIPSYSGQETALAAFLVNEMNQAGLVSRIDDAGNAVGIVKTGNYDESSPTVVLLGHMDTVQGWIPIRVDDGKLYGRGAVDAKGPLAAFIVAASRFQKSCSSPARLVVIGCVEEEAPSSKGAHFVVPHYRPKYCIVGEPSRWDRVTLGYKGFLRVTARLKTDVTHSAHPTPTAAEVGCTSWHRVAAAAERFNIHRERLFDQLLPTLVGIQSTSNGCHEFVVLRINLRLPPDLPPDAAAVWLAEQLPGFELEPVGGLPAWSGPRTTVLHRAFGRAIRAQGRDVQFQLKTGTADMNIVAPAWGCPTVAYGPGDAALDHTPHEHIELDEYLKSISVLEQVLLSAAT